MKRNDFPGYGRSEAVIEIFIIELFIIKFFIEIFIIESVIAEFAAVEDVVIIVEIIEEIIMFVEVIVFIRFVSAQKGRRRADYGAAFRTATVFRLNGAFAYFDIAIRTNCSHLNFTLL